MMRAVCLSLTLLFASASLASGASYASFKRVLSHDELMRLSPGRREAYVQGLQILLRDIEAGKRTGRMPAAASEPAPPGLPYFSGERVVCGGSGYTALKVYGVAQDTRTVNYVCVTNRFEKKKTVDVYSRGCPEGTRKVSDESPRCERVETVLGYQKTPCQIGLVPIKQDTEGAYLCATPKSFNRLPIGAQHNLRVSTYVPLVSRPGFLSKILGPGLKSYFQSTGPSLDSILAREQALEKKANATAQKWGPWESPIEHCPTIGADGELIDKAPPEYAESVRARCAAYAQNKPLPPLVKRKPKSARALAPVRVKSKAVPVRAVRDVRTVRESREGSDVAASTRIQLAPSADANWEATSDQAPDQVPDQTPDLNWCEPESRVSCDAGAIEEARAKYVSDSNPDCIYAGSVVGYEAGVKQSFKCEPPRAFCYGSATCKTDAGEAMKPAFSCGTKAVHCNPLLFGVQADGKNPFCVSRSSNATRACAEIATETPDTVQILESEHAGVREAWDDFAERVNTLCEGNATSKVLHCEECAVIRERLFKLNAAARGTENCGAALKFEERLEKNQRSPSKPVQSKRAAGANS